MIWLILAIILSTVFGQIMKWAVVRGCTTAQVAAVNYVVAAGAATAFGAFGSGLRFDGRILGIGLLGGVSYAVAIVSIFIAIRSTGIGITGTLMRVAVIVPVVGGIFVFHEMPRAIQWVGIGLTLASIALLRPPESRRAGGRVGWAAALNMILVVLTTGLGFLAWKMAQTCGHGRQSMEFMCLLYGVPALTCAAESALRKARPAPAPVVIGALLGVCNICSISASLAGLNTIPAALFFPIYGCGGVVLNAVVAALLWGERLSRANLLGIAAGAAALVCMNAG